MKDKLLCERLLQPIIVVNKTEEEVTLIPILMLISDLEQVVEKNVSSNKVDVLIHVIPFIYEQLRNKKPNEIDSEDISIIGISLKRILDILKIGKANILSAIDPTELLNNELDTLFDTTKMICNYINIDFYNFKEEVEHYE